jgi:hypothetical protein
MFIIFALPRSRTKWLSEFLGQWPRRVEHDLALQCDSIAGFVDRLSALDGTVETGAMYGWRIAQRRLPQAKLVVVRRPVPEVYESLRRVGLDVPLEELVWKRAMLDNLGYQAGVRTYSFADLSDHDRLLELYEYCLGEPCSRSWVNSLAYRNVQISIPERVAYIVSNQARISRFKEEVLREVAGYE